MQKIALNLREKIVPSEISGPNHVGIVVIKLIKLGRGSLSDSACRHMPGACFINDMRALNSPEIRISDHDDLDRPRAGFAVACRMEQGISISARPPASINVPAPCLLFVAQTRWGSHAHTCQQTHRNMKLS